jgi:hypothetical protein
MHCISFSDPVPVPDPHHFGKLDPDQSKKPDPDTHQRQKGDPDPWRVCMPVVADFHHFDEEQDPDLVESRIRIKTDRPDSDPDPQQSDKADPDPFNADPQHCISPEKSRFCLLWCN